MPELALWHQNADLLGRSAVAILIVNIGAGLVVALIFFMGSDYAPCGIFVASLNSEV